ncbi:MAG: hypothetical protein JXA67_11920, partial [Micromonosporaceae bacterium]|nr:hypothetical protein [Micromonosporaceae bacterium]
GGCRLVPQADYYRTDTDLVRPKSLRSQQWTVVRRPTVNLIVSLRFTVDSGLAGFPVQVAVPGKLRLTATALVTGRHPITFTQTCLVTKLPMVVGITSDDVPSVQWTPTVDRYHQFEDGAKLLPVECFQSVDEHGH